MGIRSLRAPLHTTLHSPAVHNSILGAYAPWEPSGLPSLVAWLDAQDASTVTHVAGAVSSWRNKANASNNVTQGTGSLQPSYTAKTINSKPAVYFNGDMMRFSTDPLPDNTPNYSYALVVRPVTYPSGAYNTLLQTLGSGDWACLLYSDRLYFRGDGGPVTLFGTMNAPGYFPIESNMIFSATVKSTNIASGSAWKHGGLLGTTVINDADNPDGTGALEIGNSIYSDFVVGEIIVSTSLWSTLDRQKAEGYLAHKWGTTGALAPTHPYKYIAP